MPIRKWKITETIRIRCDTPEGLQQILAQLKGREPARLRNNAAAELERLLNSEPQIEFDSEGGFRHV